MKGRKPAIKAAILTYMAMIIGIILLWVYNNH